MVDMVSAADLPALNTPFKNPKYIFFTDFDGTITAADSNDFMTDTVGMGRETRLGLNKQILAGTQSFRNAFKAMLDSVSKPFPECIDYMVANVQLDPHFNEYFQWALKNEIPTVVVSSGMTPVIRAILNKLVGPDSKYLDIVSNDVEARHGKTIEEEGGWALKFRDESNFGHDKSRTIRPYAQLPKDQRPTLFYAGDGVSDLSAARETDLLFAKNGQDLIKYCVAESVPFTVFNDWSDILAKVKEIVNGDISVDEAARQGHDAYKASLQAATSPAVGITSDNSKFQPVHKVNGVTNVPQGVRV